MVINMQHDKKDGASMATLDELKLSAFS